MSDFKYQCSEITVTIESLAAVPPKIKLRKGECYNCGEGQIVFKVEDCNEEGELFVSLCINCLIKMDKKVSEEL